jgi:hypothetical protein
MDLNDFVAQPIQVQILQLLRNTIYKDHFNMIERHQLMHGCIKDKMCMKRLEMQRKMHTVLDEYDAKIAEYLAKKEIPR